MGYGSTDTVRINRTRPRRISEFGDDTMVSRIARESVKANKRHARREAATLRRNAIAEHAASLAE